VTLAPDALGSMLQPGTITTLVGPLDDELAALVAAISVSWRTGTPLLPGLVPEGPGEVSFYAFAGQAISWKSLMHDICEAARIAPPMTYLRCPPHPLVRPRPAPRDAEGFEFWRRAVEVDVEADLCAAKAAGRQLTPLLTIVFNADEAAGGGAAARRQLYEQYRGRTVLMVAAETGDEAAEYGAVIELPNMHGSVRWRDLLAAVTGGDTPQIDETREEEPIWAPITSPDPDLPEMLGAVRAFFVVEGAEAMRELLRDSESTATHELKARARARGIAPARLWTAARWLDRETPPPTGGVGTLIGYGAVFNQWKEVNDPLEGHYLERIAPGAFTKTIAENGLRVKCTVSHGRDPAFDYRPLGSVTRLEEDETGLYYEVELLDNDDSGRLVPGLKAGLYRSSYTYEILREHLVKAPTPSEHNPDGLPELTILEVRCSELGPCRNPAYAGTSAGIR
jgi:HK97 family phage prohead protease